MRQINFQVDWRAAVVSWLFVLVAIVLMAIGLYAAISTLAAAHIVWWIISCVASFALGWKLRGETSALNRQDTEPPEVIEADARPVMQLPAPSHLAHEFTTRQERETIFDFTADGKRIEIPRAAVEHFIDTCYPKPDREANWHMADAAYTDAAQFLCNIKGRPLTRTGKSYTWRAGVTHDDLWRWFRAVTHPKSAEG